MASEEGRRQLVVVIRKKFVNDNSKTMFLSKHKAGSVVEAVQRSNLAAQEFMGHVLMQRGFGMLGQEQLSEIVLEAVERDQESAQMMMANPQTFLELLGNEKMQDAICVAIFRHASCKQYFMTHFKEKFSSVALAGAVYLAVDKQARERFSYSH